MSNNKKQGHTCSVAVKDDNPSGWSICGKPSVRDVGYIAQIKHEDGTEQMGRYLCEDHKTGSVIEVKSSKKEKNDE